VHYARVVHITARRHLPEFPQHLQIVGTAILKYFRHVRRKEPAHPLTQVYFVLGAPEGFERLIIKERNAKTCTRVCETYAVNKGVLDGFNIDRYRRAQFSD